MLFYLLFSNPTLPQILRTPGTHADDLTHSHCIPNPLYFHSEITLFFFSSLFFHLSLFLKIQYPTHGYTREPPHSIVPPASASGNTPTRTGVLGPAPLTPDTFHHLGTPSPRGSLPRPLRTQPPTTPLSPRPPSSRSQFLRAPFIPHRAPLRTEHAQPHRRRVPAAAVAPQFRAPRPGRSGL